MAGFHKVADGKIDKVLEAFITLPDVYVVRDDPAYTELYERIKGPNALPVALMENEEVNRLQKELFSDSCKHVKTGLTL